jgi:hypothetical protein
MQDFDKGKKGKRQSGGYKEMPTVTKAQYEKNKAAAGPQKRNPSPMSEADYERKRANNMGANVDKIAVGPQKPNPSRMSEADYVRKVTNNMGANIDRPSPKPNPSPMSQYTIDYERKRANQGPTLSTMSEHHATSAQEAELKRGRDMPLSATPTAAPRSRVAEVLSSIRQNRADNLSSKADKIKAIADRKESSADKISARKQGKAEIIRARAELIKAKQGR